MPEISASDKFRDHEDRIAFLESIIRANKLHEADCPAFNPEPGGFGDIFGSLGRSHCDCWIAPDIIETLEETETTQTVKAIGIYDLRTSEVNPNIAFNNRRAAKNQVLFANEDLSADPKSDNYWRKTFLPVEVTYQIQKKA